MTSRPRNKTGVGRSSHAEPAAPVRVAVLGGGCASMAAAFELTRPEHRGRFQVTVYQMGWRLGGKGASGRGPADRIEEHGLHLWMGFYENAFGLMRDCYKELARDPDRYRIADWRDAFVPDELNAVADVSPSGDWSPWRVLFPPTPGEPGDPPTPGQRWTVAAYLVRCISLLRTMINSLPTAGNNKDAASRPQPTTQSDPSAESLIGQIGRLMKYGQLATLGALLEALGIMELVVRALPSVPENVLLSFHGAVATAVRRQIEVLTRSDDELRRLWEIADLVLTVLRGAVRFKLTTDPRGFDAINDYDCREWLRLNGASDMAINSSFVRALYDLAFAYEDGDVTRPRIAAGQALRGAVRAFFTYRGAFFWKMRTGMGDAVFAPLYEVLVRRGARFEFFHRLENLEVADGKPGERPHIAAIELDLQAEVRGGGSYRPLYDVRGLPCWPAAPDYAQLQDGDRLKREGWDFESPWDARRSAKKRLRLGKDFDLVVLGVGVGAIPHVCRDIVARDPRWRAMTQFVKSVPTQAFQVWMTPGVRELGWPHGAGNLSGFVEPFDTWADMTHLAGEESFRERPGSIAYFCSVLPDRPDAAGIAYARARALEVKRNAIRFLNRDIGHLWPNARRGSAGFRWELLADGSGGNAEGRPDAQDADETRFDSQYWRANVNPSDRYSLALPGTLRYRISPLDNSYDNLTVTGDWTDCGFNEGCVEAAVMSGRLAAHALSQSPRLEDIVGYDHP
jgi:uncharacterized protein with NAD-binding domain and iron-sulfur cluster